MRVGRGKRVTVATGSVVATVLLVVIPCFWEDRTSLYHLGRLFFDEKYFVELLDFGCKDVVSVRIDPSDLWESPPEPPPEPPEYRALRLFARTERGKRAILAAAMEQFWEDEHTLPSAFFPAFAFSYAVWSGQGTGYYGGGVGRGNHCRNERIGTLFMLLAEFRDGLERTISGFPGMCVAVTSPEIAHSRYGVDLREEMLFGTELVLIVRPRRAIPATGGKEAAIVSTPRRDRDNR